MSDSPSSQRSISLGLFAFFTLSCIPQQSRIIYTFLALSADMSLDLFLDLFLNLFFPLDLLPGLLSLSLESLELSLDWFLFLKFDLDGNLYFFLDLSFFFALRASRTLSRYFNFC